MTKPPTYNLYLTNIYQVPICLLSLKVIRAVVMLLLANQWMINWSFTQFLCRFWLRWPGWDKRNAINYWKTPTTFSTNNIASSRRMKVYEFHFKKIWKCMYYFGHTSYPILNPWIPIFEENKHSGILDDVLWINFFEAILIEAFRSPDHKIFF